MAGHRRRAEDEDCRSGIAPFDVVKERTEYFYNDKGFYLGYKRCNVARRIQLRRELEYLPQKNGSMKIVNPWKNGPMLTIIWKENETLVKKTSYNDTYVYKDSFPAGSTYKDLEDHIAKWARLGVLQGGREKGTMHRHVSLKDNETEIITREIGEDGRLLALHYDYSSEENLMQEQEISFQFNGDGSFIRFIEDPKDSEKKHNEHYIYTPLEDGGYRVQEYYDGKYYEDKDRTEYDVNNPKNINNQFSDYFFCYKTDLEPELEKRAYSSLRREFEAHPNGKVSKIFEYEIKFNEEEIAEIDLNNEDIPLMQDDAVPLTSDNKPMEYLGMLTGGDLFGGYYLFLDPKENIIVQVYQCT